MGKIGGIGVRVPTAKRDSRDSSHSFGDPLNRASQSNIPVHAKKSFPHVIDDIHYGVADKEGRINREGTNGLTDADQKRDSMKVNATASSIQGKEEVHEEVLNPTE